MKIRQGVDMGKAFDKLKDGLIRAEKELNDSKYTNEGIGRNYAASYGILSACVQCVLFYNSDAKTMAEIMQPETNPDTLTSK